jgi:hypothetical protein
LCLDGLAVRYGHDERERDKTDTIHNAIGTGVRELGKGGRKGKEGNGHVAGAKAPRQDETTE